MEYKLYFTKYTRQVEMVEAPEPLITPKCFGILYIFMYYIILTKSKSSNNILNKFNNLKQY